MKDGLLLELKRVINGLDLNPVFQPIFCLKTGKTLGFEALIRGPENTELENPTKLFHLAAQFDLINELEEACWQVCCYQFKQLQYQEKLFLNINLEAFTSQNNLPNILSQLRSKQAFKPGQIALQIPSPFYLDYIDDVIHRVTEFKSSDVNISLPCAGYQPYCASLWSKLAPDFIKLERYLVNGLDDSRGKLEAIKGLVTLASNTGTQIIAENIENDSELSRLQQCGVHGGQGYYLSKPEPQPSTENPINEPLPSNQQSGRQKQTLVTAESMVTRVHPLGAQVTMEEVADLFQKNNKLGSLPVVEQGTPIGIVTRRDLQNLFSGRYFRDLNGKKSVHHFMSTDFISVEIDESIEEVSKKVTMDPEQDISQDFIITQDNAYTGVGKVRTLLKRITELEITTARYANPLTLLPGNVPIDETIDQLLISDTNFRVAYFDINNFKPFNDSYGYSAGDDVILLLAQVLESHCDIRKDMVGHVGGDDFVVIFQSADWHQRCEAIRENFNTKVLNYYSETDIQQNGIYSENRRGDREFFGFITVSAGVVHPNPCQCNSYHDVSYLAASAKKEAKKFKESCIYISRRRQPDGTKTSHSS